MILDRKLAQTVARYLWEAGCITIKAKPSYRWASGIRSPIYTDNRVLLAHPKGRSAIVAAFLQLIRRQRLRCDAIAGVATSGIPLATLVADRLKKPMAYVRPQPKAHGRGRQIEGEIKKGARVLLIEDLVSTGASSVAAAKALKKAGARVTHVLATFAYLPELAAPRFPVPLLTLCDAETLLTVGRSRKQIGPAKEKAARAFLEKLAKQL